MRLLQIVPRLPPPTDGVGDYAVALARALAVSGTPTVFLVPGPKPKSEPEEPNVAVRTLHERTAGALADALAAWGDEPNAKAAILVHYANYGYADRGCPHWLIDGLLEWRRRSRGGTPLISFFHEVYASGPPWRSSFWLSPTQRRLAGALARASERVVTSLEIYRDLLAPWVLVDGITLLPVLSTVGELAAPQRLAARRRRLVVFGGPGTRARAYGELAEEVAAACAALQIAEIADVGPAPDAAPAEIAGVPVTRLGELPAAAVSALLADSLAGFVSHRPAFFGKSTVLAAYCAHGMLPVAAYAGSGDVSGVRAWTASADRGDAALQVVADDDAAWYVEHSIARQVAVFQRLLAAPAGEQR
jgi:hypothetical protein